MCPLSVPLFLSLSLLAFKQRERERERESREEERVRRVAEKRVKHEERLRAHPPRKRRHGSGGYKREHIKRASLRRVLKQRSCPIHIYVCSHDPPSTTAITTSLSLSLSQRERRKRGGHAGARELSAARSGSLGSCAYRTIQTIQTIFVFVITYKENYMSFFFYYY